MGCLGGEECRGMLREAPPMHMECVKEGVCGGGGRLSPFWRPHSPAPPPSGLG